MTIVKPSESYSELSADLLKSDKKDELAAGSQLRFEIIKAKEKANELNS